MKYYLLTVFFLSFLFAKAQYTPNKLSIVNFDINSTVHFISPEKIRYVDISSHSYVGDLPIDNILRVKALPDSTAKSIPENSLLTIIGESFIAQYKLEPRIGNYTNELVNILPENMVPLESPLELTTQEMRHHAMDILSKRPFKTIRKTEKYKLGISLNNVYTIGGFIFLDLTFHNRTNLAYDIDELRFKIEDRKISKATNVQSIEILPCWKLYQTEHFKNSFRNLYVFKKVTFPANKILQVELSEKQISGRVTTLKIKYKDILNADTF